MDIRELQSFQLSDAVKFHDHLNPKIFHGQHVRPEVEKQLKIIAGDFLEELGVDGLDVQDITISGSNAAYSYTPHSDLDLHILVDMTKLHNDDMYRELFTAKKNAYNDSHDIKIHGIPVELYIQDSNQPVISLGEYSIKNNKWLKIPSKRRANFDQTATAKKYEKILAVIERALKTQKLDRVQNVLNTIKRYRQAGLDKGGEFGPENLAYKALRSRGYITALYKLRDELHSKELSIEGMYAENNKFLNKPTPTVEQLVIKYKVPKQDILIQLDKGIKVELEHTKDRSIAREIALDHINEDPHYYNKLAKVNIEESMDSEIHNYHKLDRILAKLCKMVVKGQSSDKDYGMVGACVLDPDNNIVAGLNSPGVDGKRVHAERVAIEKYEQKYGEVPEGSIVLTTLSPCNESNDETAHDRVGESCTDYLNSKGIEKVYCGYIDPTQDNDQRQFNLMETGNQDIREECKSFADTFLNEARTNPDQNVKAESGMKELEAVAKTISDPENWAVSMTGEPKLGINPQVGISEDTPKGIYFYPLNYVLGMIKRRKPLPWGDNMPYIQLFQYDRSNQMTKQTEVDSAKLKQALSQYCSPEIMQQATEEDEYDGTPYWYIYDCLSRLGKSDETNVVRWNKVLRDLGFTSVFDSGNGWIAYNEPTQGVVLDPRIIKQHKTISNRKEASVVTPANIEQAIFETMDMELAANRAWQAYDPDGSKLRAAAKEYAKDPKFKSWFGKPGTEEIYDNASALGRYGARQLSDEAWAWYKAQQSQKPVNEAFDQPYKLKWEKGDYGDVDAYAKLDDGNYLSIMFNKGYNQDKEEAWNVEFWRNNSQEVTGEGDAQRVFATVLGAIQTFIKKYKPNKVIFSASKEVEQGQNAQSSARLYDSLVQRYARAWGFKAFRADTGDKVIYELSKIKPVAEASGYIPSEKEKNDPRFKTALTVDVKPDSIKKNAKAFSWLTNRAGVPPTASPSGKI